MKLWSGAAGRERTLAVTAWLTGWQESPPPECVEPDGRVVLTGYNMVAGAALLMERERIALPPDATIKVEKRRWERIDFTGAKMRGVVFENMVISDCVFDKADLRDSRWAGCEVSHSRLHDANLRDARLSLRWNGVTRPSSWRSCSFNGSTYMNDQLDYTQFVDCRLEFKIIRDVSFYNSRFEHCSFGGAMSVLFDSRPLEGSSMRPLWKKEKIFPVTFSSCDFSRAVFVDVDFKGCVFDDVVWPPGERLLEVPSYGRAVDHIRTHRLVEGTRAERFFDLMFHPSPRAKPLPDSTLILNVGIFAEDQAQVEESLVTAFSRANTALRLPPPVVHGPPRAGSTPKP